MDILIIKPFTVLDLSNNPFEIYNKALCSSVKNYHNNGCVTKMQIYLL